MRRHLLDTNTVSDMVKNPGGRVEARIRSAGGNSAVYTSVIVAAELRFGAAKKSSRLVTQLELILGRMMVAPFEPPADRLYGDLRAELERAGTPIGANDLWIAAQALHDGSVLVTDNTREFGRVPGLAIENWLT